MRTKPHDHRGFDLGVVGSSAALARALASFVVREMTLERPRLDTAPSA